MGREKMGKQAWTWGPDQTQVEGDETGGVVGQGASQAPATQQCQVHHTGAGNNFCARCVLSAMGGAALVWR